MKISEIKEMTKEELETKLEDIKKGLFNLKFQKATGQLNSPVKIRNLRKDIARIKTLIKEKEFKTETDNKTDKVNKK
ncbi:MAG: 50S ribosomal protein L29 [Actinomycetota bacterium]|nr:50S ribosomal protein L29 [Actinomycetota bacterium]